MEPKVFLGMLLMASLPAPLSSDPGNGKHKSAETLIDLGAFARCGRDSNPRPHA